jgi:hypothetical protein
MAASRAYVLRETPTGKVVASCSQNPTLIPT